MDLMFFEAESVAFILLQKHGRPAVDITHSDRFSDLIKGNSKSRDSAGRMVLANREVKSSEMTCIAWNKAIKACPGI
jgi:hypothetical protein